MNPQISRLMIIFCVLVALFMFGRWMAQPSSFYDYGHYRGDALREASVVPENYAAKDRCAECHEEQVEQNAGGGHIKISCQNCHGPGKGHAAEPSPDNIVRPAVETLCVRCHAANQARPKRFPQVNAQEHAEGKPCITCHVTHNPSEMVEEDKPAPDSTAADSSAAVVAEVHP